MPEVRRDDQGLSKERDITSTLRKFADGIYVGSSVDIRLGVTTIDVRRLPESPWHAADIKKSVVDMFMRAIHQAVQDGEVLISCTYGVNRAPCVAKLYCIGAGLEFNWAGSFPNKSWREYVQKNYDYYQKNAWA